MSSLIDFNKVLETGRPPNIKYLFPHSRALIVSGKVIDRAMIAKGNAMTIAANGRSHLVIRGALQAAQRANAAIIIEIARSEGGATAYCATNYWNMSRQVDAICNELAITIPVAIHADHYGIKTVNDIPFAKKEIPSIFDAGVTSIAIDASHMADDDNLLANIELADCFPAWAGYETEIGEIKGKFGLSSPGEALFLVQGLNAHGIYPDWIALNNGTTHGIEASDQGIQVDLTKEVHEALAPFHISGAQHGTSGNNSDRLRAIVAQTRTTKANVATALQMILWGLDVNDYGNAILDDNGDFVKVKGEGVTEELWADMKEYAVARGWQKGDYKQLNLVFENRILGQVKEVRERMASRVEKFVYTMLVDVFNAADTADYAIKALAEAGSYDLGPKVGRLELAEDWTVEKIRKKSAQLDTDKGPEGDFDD